MIYDKRAELARYFGLSPNLDAAIRFLQTLTSPPCQWGGLRSRRRHILQPLYLHHGSHIPGLSF